MKELSQLINSIETCQLINYLPNILVSTVEVDSRKVQQGSMFVCIRGEKFDGHKFAWQAVEAGASVIVCEQEVEIDIPQIIVPCTKTAISTIAAAYYDFPSKQLKVIGITGTNGKTTTSYILRHIFNSTKNKCGLIGTVEVDDGNTVSSASLTTPQPLELQSYMSNMVKNNCKYVVMEVSSHALALQRVNDVDFYIAGFTNLTQDHLDYHSTMNNYRAVKGTLFGKANKAVVINKDDKAGIYMAEQAKVPVTYYSCQQLITDGICITGVKFHGNRTEFNLHYYGDCYQVQTNLIGKFNVYNIMLAFGVAVSCGINPEQIVSALKTFEPVPGRFMTVKGCDDFSIIVDYAHSPDALANVLRTARTLTSNRLIVVFGCGGDRDKTKRPLMGEVAADYADIIILTSDNPRTEDPHRIISDISEGVLKRKARFDIEVDREKAIENAVKCARKGDIIVIAGKGHETYQIVGSDILPFDDSVVAAQKYNEVKDKCIK